MRIGPLPWSGKNSTNRPPWAASLPLGTKLRAAACLVAWLIASAAYLRGSTASVLARLMSFDETKAAYGVLFLLGLVWLFSKRSQVLDRMRASKTNVFLLALTLGAVTAATVLLPQSEGWKLHYGAFGAFTSLSFGLALFAAIFPSASRFPALAVAPGIVAFGISAAIRTLAYAPFSLAPVAVSVPLLSALGIPITHQGSIVWVAGPSGQPVSALVDIGCSGHTGMAIIAGFWLLMMLDVRPTWKRSLLALALGMIGAWLENLLRLIALFVVGHFWGEHALWSIHSYVNYILFPAYYALFAYLWIRLAGARIGLLQGRKLMRGRA